MNSHPSLSLFTFFFFAFLTTSCTLPGSNETGTQEESCVSLQTLREQLELPAYSDEEDLVRYDGFVSSYNHTTLVPNWVAYELTSDELNGSYDTKSSSFSRDPNVKGRQASREDYSHSGWDKGHMAPKADMRWSEKAYWQSHYFPNICPQNHELNRYDWNTLEKSVRHWARQYGTVWVVCGPIFEKGEFGKIGDAGVQVPDYFFKALLIRDGDSYSAIAYVMHNDARHHKLADYACTVNDLEERIGRDLFPALDDTVEEQIEGAIDWNCWN